MRYTTRYLTALTLLSLLGSALTPALAADAPQAAPADETPTVEIDPQAPATVTEEHTVEVVDVEPAKVPDTDPADAGVQAGTITPDPATPIDVMDRSTWPALVVTPADGKATHHPHFMGDPPMGDDIVSPLHAPDPVWQIQEALRGADAGNWNGENLAALGAQPFIATAQILAIPFRAAIDNPLSKETSPK